MKRFLGYAALIATILSLVVSVSYSQTFRVDIPVYATRVQNTTVDTLTTAFPTRFIKNLMPYGTYKTFGSLFSDFMAPDSIKLAWDATAAGDSIKAIISYWTRMTGGSWGTLTLLDTCKAAGGAVKTFTPGNYTYRDEMSLVVKGITGNAVVAGNANTLKLWLQYYFRKP